MLTGGDAVVYLSLKGEADDYLRSRDLDWTVLRPAMLTGDPGTDRILVGTGLPLGSIPRADVAALLARLLIHSDGLRRQFEVTSRRTYATWAGAADSSLVRPAGCRMALVKRPSAGSASRRT